MNIYVGNLSYDATESDLRELFSEFGEVTSVKIISDFNSGRSKGFGFVEMAVDEEGDKAIAELDGADVKGRAIKVNKARPRKEFGGGDGGGGRRGGGGGGPRRF